MSTVANGVGTQSTTNTTTYTTASFTPTAGDFLVAVVVASDTATDGTLTDSQGLLWELVDSHTTFTTNRLMIFAARQPADASAMTVTWDCTADAATACIIQVVRFVGSDGYIRQVATLNSGAGTTTPTCTFPVACLSSSSIIFIQANLSNPHGMTKPASPYLVLVGTVTSTPSTSSYIAYRNTGETTDTITAGGTSATDWVSVAVEVYNTGVGAQPSSNNSNGYYGNCIGI